MSSPRIHQPSPTPAPTYPSGSIARAWISAILIPVAFVVAFIVGEGLISALGYSSDETVPLLVGLAVTIPVTLVAMIPAALAVWYGGRATRDGHRTAVFAVALGWLALAYWVITFVLALVQRLTS